MPMNNLAFDDLGYRTRNTITNKTSSLESLHRSFRLFFPVETKALRTPFRVEVLNLIYEIAIQKLGNQIDSVRVQVNVDSYDSSRVGLLLSIWADIDKHEWIEADRSVSEAIFRLEENWTEDEINDYTKMIDFEILPLRI